MTNQSARVVKVVDVPHAAAVAAEYEAHQGLVWAVWGAGLLAAVSTGEIFTFVTVGGLLAVSLPRWYYRRYGLVRPTTRRHMQVMIGAVLSAGLVLLGYLIDREFGPPVLFSVALLSGALCVGQLLLLRRTGLSRLHWAVYVVVAAAAAGPLFGWGRGENLDAYAMSMTGAAMVVLGVIDHRRLVRALTPIRDED